MDILSIQPHDREVEFVNPATEKGTGFFLQLRNPYSEEVQAADRKWRNNLFAKRKLKMTAEMQESALETKIIATVSGWRFEGDASIGGEKPKFSPAALRELIRKSPWIKDFLDREIGDTEGFFTI